MQDDSATFEMTVEELVKINGDYQEENERLKVRDYSSMAIFLSRVFKRFTIILITATCLLACNWVLRCAQVENNDISKLIAAKEAASKAQSAQINDMLTGLSGVSSTHIFCW